MHVACQLTPRGGMSFVPPLVGRRQVMSKNAGRKKRWTTVNAKTHTSALGRVVYDKDAWWGLLDYRTRRPGEGGPEWERHEQRLGPFRRPRDAMVAVEREATILKNRHGADVLFGDQVWADA